MLKEQLEAQSRELSMAPSACETPRRSPSDSASVGHPELDMYSKYLNKGFDSVNM